MIDDVAREFKKLFTGSPLIIQSPGRVNLIGEHTDYNDGFVMPAAINASIWFAISPSTSKDCRLFALDLDDTFEFEVDDITNTQSPWGMYIKGVTSQFVDKGIQGFNCVFGGNIPQGAGLSSSAALTCGLAFAINHMFETKLEPWALAQIAQIAEHRYAKVNCGIMDQFANLFSKENAFSMLDCQNYTYEQCEWQNIDYDLLLIDTKVKHSLASTEYNIRKQDCDVAVSLIQSEYPEVSSLRDVDADMISSTSFLLGERLERRVTYVVEENERVKKCFEAIKNNNYETIGRLLNESHLGLSEKYHVSCDELDFLASEATKSDSVLGSRMMGGGFGGCTLNLVKKNETNEFLPALKMAYEGKFGVTPDYHIVELSNGTRIL